MKQDETIKQLIEVLAKNLRLLRAVRGISQDELAALSGLDRTYVSGCERALRNPTVATLAKFGHALNVDVTDLLAQDLSEDLEKG